MKEQINLRASKITRAQLDELVAVLGGSRTEILTIAIDRLWRQEIGESMITEADFVKDDGQALDFSRGYVAYGQEIERTGATRARTNLLTALRRHVEKVCQGETQDYIDTQIRLAANAFFANSHQEPYKSKEAFR